MFFNLVILKKLMKEAYKGYGLTIARTVNETPYWGTKEGIYVQGSYWEIWFELEAMPKEVKAGIIEMAGDLPEQGKPFRANKEGNQYEIEIEEFLDLPERAEAAENKFRVTNMIRKIGLTNYRLLQDQKTHRIRMINEVFMKLIELSAMGPHDVTPVGPVSLNENGHMFYWWNGCCCLRVNPILEPEEGTEEDAFLGHLERISVI